MLLMCYCIVPTNDGFAGSGMSLVGTKQSHISDLSKTSHLSPFKLGTIFVIFADYQLKLLSHSYKWNINSGKLSQNGSNTGRNTKRLEQRTISRNQNIMCWTCSHTPQAQACMLGILKAIQLQILLAATNA